MSDIDLTEAVEAGSRALAAINDSDWDTMGGIEKFSYRNMVTPVVAAATPVIEEALRTQLIFEGLVSDTNEENAELAAKVTELQAYVEALEAEVAMHEGVEVPSDDDWWLDNMGERPHV